MAITHDQYLALQSELASDPSALGYAGKADAAAASLLVAATQTQAIDVAAAQVMNVLMLRGAWPAIELLVAHGVPSGQSPPTAADKALGAAIALLRLCTATPEQMVRMSDAATNAAVKAQLAALVANNTIAQGDSDAVLALAGRNISRAELIGIPALVDYDAASQAYHVTVARAGRF